MKHKAIHKKIEGKNKAFIEAIKSSVGKNEEKNQQVLEDARKSGLFSKLRIINIPN